MSKWIKNTGTKPNTQGKPLEVRLRDGAQVISTEESLVNYGDGFDWNLEDVDGDIIEWRYVEPVKADLTQAEVQSLLNITRKALNEASGDKEMFKRLAADNWNLCNKDDPSTQVAFNFHSLERKIAQEAKQREKKLVALITKLKGLR